MIISFIFSNKDQILFMVGRGFLKPSLDKLRTDTPKALRRLLLDCLRLVIHVVVMTLVCYMVYDYAHMTCYPMDNLKYYNQGSKEIR